MTVQEIQQVYVNHGMPGIIAEQQARGTIRDLHSLPGGFNLAYLQCSIQQRVMLFQYQQEQIGEMIERKRKYLKKSFAYGVEYK